MVAYHLRLCYGKKEKNSYASNTLTRHFRGMKGSDKVSLSVTFEKLAKIFRTRFSTSLSSMCKT